ncbi:hypothetical protein GQ53DRAFT_718575 [Thozetella sp. PMI_491]|nr:hypothetical protein GQ53DRAFT_718575 [Thozetella sp. PMI_491]
MALKPPDNQEQVEIIENLCHLRSPSNRHHKAFLRFYTTTCLERGDIFVPINPPIFKAHSEVIEAVKTLRNSATSSKDAFQSLAFPTADALERDWATRTAVKLAFLVDSASKDDYSGGYQMGGPFPVKWEADKTFLEFLEGAFPTYTPKSFQKSSFGHSLRAWKLKKRYGIQLVPTDDLVQHLMYDRQTSTIMVFRHTAVLKSHLRHTGSQPLDLDLEETVKLGSLKPQLLLETLLTVYYILLPLSVDRRSARLAESLVRKKKFDPNLIVDDGSIRTIPKDFEFVYWAERLEILEGVTANPPPANKLVGWMERHTSERNALTVAILGVFLAVLFGFLSFVVGIAQLIVSILAWKYPAGLAA